MHFHINTFALQYYSIISMQKGLQFNKPGFDGKSKIGPVCQEKQLNLMGTARSFI